MPQTACYHADCEVRPAVKRVSTQMRHPDGYSLLLLHDTRDTVAQRWGALRSLCGFGLMLLCTCTRRDWAIASCCDGRVQAEDGVCDQCTQWSQTPTGVLLRPSFFPHVGCTTGDHHGPAGCKAMRVDTI